MSGPAIKDGEIVPVTLDITPREQFLLLAAIDVYGLQAAHTTEDDVTNMLDSVRTTKLTFTIPQEAGALLEVVDIAMRSPSAEFYKPLTSLAAALLELCD